jgi:hypothetical protein
MSRETEPCISVTQTFNAMQPLRPPQHTQDHQTSRQNTVKGKGKAHICFSVGIYRQNTTSTISGVFLLYNIYQH